MSEKLGLVGRKIGMTRIFTEDGVSVPVTVLDVSNNRVTMVKTQETDGYTAVQVAFGTKKPSRVSKPLAGHFAKAGVEAACTLKEFRIDAEKAAEFTPGQTISVEIFTEGQKVDVTGTTIGKGFAGAIKSGGSCKSQPPAFCSIPPCIILPLPVPPAAAFSPLSGSSAP